MAEILNNVTVPTFQIKIPSNGKELTMRPFLVKEEKILLMAMEGKNTGEIINTVKDTIKSCLVEGEVNIDSLPFFDVDYLFIALRAKSIGEKVNVSFKCKNIFEGKECGKIFNVGIDISNCKVKKDPTIEDKITLGSTHTVKLKYPNYATMKFVNDSGNVLDEKLTLLAGCVEYIQQKQKVFTSKDLSPKEVKAFFEGLTQEQFSKFERFIDNLPSFVITAEEACPQCKFVHHLEYKDFADFFI